jgi:hypothetical protein
MVLWVILADLVDGDPQKLIKADQASFSMISHT